MDRRVKYTKKIIKETFLELLNEKELNKITVSEICSRADINRATFYRYYLDVYNLLDKIQEELITELKTAYTNEEVNNYSISGFIESILEIFMENKELIKILFNTNSNIYFLNNFLEVFYEKCKLRWEENISTLSNEEIEYCSIFIFNGALGVINYWIKNDFEDTASDIAQKIDDLSKSCINNFINKN